MDDRRRFEQQEDFAWQPYRVKPLAVWAMRMNVEFQCPTLQGTLHGKAGDWIVRADDGATFPVQDEVFRRYYVKREWRKPNEAAKERPNEGDAPPTPIDEAHAAHDGR